jgi:hypothetical protein
MSYPPEDGRRSASGLAVGRGIALTVLLVSALLSGCSSAEPEIMQTELRIVATWRPDTGTVTEELFLVTDIFDPDGIEDVGEVRLAHDGEQLQWRAPADTLPRRSRAGQDWFTLSAASVNGAGEIPRGTYRVEVDDLSGRGDARRISVPLDVPATGPGDLPEFNEEGIVIPSGVDTVIIAHIPDDGEARFYQITADAEEATRVPLRELPEPLHPFVPGEARSASAGTVWLIHEVSTSLLRRSGPWR